MTAPTAIIGGQERHLGGWAPAERKLRGVKPAVDLAALPMQHTIGGFPTDYDQGSLNSCGPNSIAELYEYDLHGKFSRLFVYWFTRATEGNFLIDDGVTIPTLIEIAHTMGLPPEELWPYELGKFQVPPPESTLVEAVRHRVERQDIVVDLEHLLLEISNQQPVILGFQVPASMEDGQSLTAAHGVVDMPGPTNPVIGGHCVNAFKFDRGRQLVGCTCHYGPGFGDGGTIWLPFAMWEAGFVMDMRAIRGIS